MDVADDLLGCLARAGEHVDLCRTTVVIQHYADGTDVGKLRELLLELGHIDPTAPLVVLHRARSVVSKIGPARPRIPKFRRARAYGKRANYVLTALRGTGATLRLFGSCQNGACGEHCLLP